MRFKNQIALFKCVQNQIHKNKVNIPRKNAVTKRTALLRGITYFLMKWKESALADSSFYVIINLFLEKGIDGEIPKSG